jgi:threonylcarbamoyladenosine tRNA methylthiotransferase MtaB
MKVVLETLGCKLNQAETESLTWELATAGYEISSEIEQADIFILNTCTVTNTADAKSRQRIRQVYKINPTALIVTTGCYAQRDPEALGKIPGLELVVSNENKANLVHLLGERFHTQSNIRQFPTTSPSSLRTRAFIKVQEGCNGVCSYCIVPQVRKGETSVPAERIIEQIKHRETFGFKEVVLTGTKVGCYTDRTANLTTLLTKILGQTSVPRIRLSSLQPQEISSELLSLWNDHRLLPHFHLALQSACDKTLCSMKRRYSLDGYKETVRKIREIIPDAAITTDIIIGFPGETNGMFEENYRTCKEMRFARIHVFPYSPRPGTEAALMEDTVSDTIKKERSRKMLALATQSAGSFRKIFHGQERPVLWESRDNRGNWMGWTDNYIMVKTKGDNLANQISPKIID